MFQFHCGVAIKPSTLTNESLCQAIKLCKELGFSFVIIDAEYSEYCVDPVSFKKLSSEVCDESFSLLPTVQVKRKRYRRVLTNFLKITGEIVLVPGNKAYMKPDEKRKAFRGEMKKLIDELSCKGVTVFAGTEKCLDLIITQRNLGGIIPFPLLTPRLSSETSKLRDHGFEKIALYIPFHILERGEEIPECIIKYVERRLNNETSWEEQLGNYAVVGLRKEMKLKLKKLRGLADIFVFHPMSQHLEGVTIDLKGLSKELRNLLGKK